MMSLVVEQFTITEIATQNDSDDDIVTGAAIANPIGTVVCVFFGMLFIAYR
jgi:hypothetical protein